MLLTAGLAGLLLVVSRRNCTSGWLVALPIVPPSNLAVAGESAVNQLQRKGYREATGHTGNCWTTTFGKAKADVEEFTAG